MNQNQFEDCGEGVLFTEDNKKSDRSPDMTGSIEIEGKAYRIVAWNRVGTRSGKEFLSIKVSPQREKSQQEPQSSQNQSPPAQTFTNDDVPF
tara:strand:- start:78 stop:353 length:276 start_codon:yes stop_codon:yes gene_type:complete